MFPPLISLAGALVYGAADFLGGLAARQLRSIVVTATAAGAGLVLLAVCAGFFGGEYTWTDAAWGAASGVTGALAIGLLYACLAIGPMSILSPLTAVVSAIAPMLWGFFVDGETFAATGYLGLGVAMIAVVLVGFVPGEGAVRPSVKGIAMAVGSGLSIGAFLVLLDQTSSESGLLPLVTNRAVNMLITGTIVGVMILVARRRGQSAASAVRTGGPTIGAAPSGHADLEHARAASSAPARTSAPNRWSNGWLLAIACGLSDTLANVLLLVALRVGDLAVVSALTALYPAGTILLAAVVLREKIAPIQGVGLALAVAAGALLATA